MPQTILETLFIAVSNKDNKVIEKLRSEKTLLKILGVDTLPKNLDKLEYLVTDKLLHLAIEDGNEKKVRNLLSRKWLSKEKKHKIDVEVLDAAQTTPLMHAVQTGKLEIVKLLMQEGVDINSQNAGGQTALILAAQLGHIDIATLLISSGAMLGVADAQGKNALMWAAQSNHAELVVALMERDGNPFNIDKFEMNPLRYAIRNNSSESVVALLDGIIKSHGLEIMKEHATEALVYVREIDNSKMAKLLIEKGANPNHEKPPIDQYKEKIYTQEELQEREKSLANGINSIMAQSVHDDAPYAQVTFSDMLSRYYTDITKLQKQTELRSQLSSALISDPKIGYGSKELDAEKKKLHKASNEINLAFYKESYDDISRELHEYFKTYVSFMQVDEPEKRQIIMYNVESLIERDRHEAFKLLIDAGFDVNQKDPRGRCALDLAVEYNRTEMVELLLENAAQPSPDLIQKCKKSISKDFQIIGETRDASAIVLNRLEGKQATTWAKRVMKNEDPSKIIVR